MNASTRTPAWRPAVLLALVALLGTALLAGTWQITRDRIAAEERRVVLRELQQLVPASRFNNALQDDRIRVVDPEAFATDAPVDIWRARMDGEPVAAIMKVTAPGGYNGDIELLLAIEPGGRLIGVRVTRHRETPGLGDAIEAGRSNWSRQFSGRSLGDPPAQDWEVQRDGGAFTQLTGATITPRAVVRAVARALAYFSAHEHTLFDQPSEAGDV